MPRSLPWTKWRGGLDATAAVAMIAAAALLGHAILTRPAGSQEPNPPAPIKRNDIPVPTDPISLDGAHLKGAATAPVVMLEYSEFECPYCKRIAQETLPLLADEYINPGRVALAFKHLPLEKIHHSAFRAAETGVCADERGRFWPFHDGLFASASPLSEQEIGARAAAAGVSEEQLVECLSSGRAAGRVRASMKEAGALGARTTPVFFVGRRTADGKVAVADVIRGAQPITVFRAAFEPLLAQARRD